MMPNILGIGDVHECSQFCSRNFGIVKCHFTGFLPASLVTMSFHVAAVCGWIFQ